MKQLVPLATIRRLATRALLSLVVAGCAAEVEAPVKEPNNETSLGQPGDLIFRYSRSIADDGGCRFANCSHVTGYATQLTTDEVLTANFVTATEYIEFVEDYYADEVAGILATFGAHFTYTTASGIYEGYAADFSVGTGAARSHIRDTGTTIVAVSDNVLALTGTIINEFEEDTSVTLGYLEFMDQATTAVITSGASQMILYQNRDMPTLRSSDMICSAEIGGCEIR